MTTKVPERLKTYECRIENYFSEKYAHGSGISRDLISTHSAKNASAARYLFWYEHSECLNSYSECFRHIKSKSLGRSKLSDWFGDFQQFTEVCRKRNVDFARLGMTIDVDGKKGWIVGANNYCNLEVLFEQNVGPQNCHPTWETTYYDKKGNIIREFKKVNVN